MIEEIKNSSETSNDLVEIADMDFTRASLFGVPSNVEVVDDAKSLPAALVNVIDNATNDNASTVISNDPAFWCSLSSNQRDYFIQCGPFKIPENLII